MIKKFHFSLKQHGPSYAGLLKAQQLAGGTQADLAKVLDVSQAAISKMMRSKKPLKAEDCIKLMNALGISREEMRPTDYWEVWPELKAPEDRKDI
ncbi:helix-turn-helix domain-containing protein [Bordetella sp. FB-8]|uniref:transcriptional regulator n=1 Tax=Bordetella sp. FB-8 TaxID=1159870 RepID=UPI00037BAE49|nr:helix-turn-helix domain-containing protein [Bordetella sp. FB-8]